MVGDDGDRFGGGDRSPPSEAGPTEGEKSEDPPGHDLEVAAGEPVAQAGHEPDGGDDAQPEGQAADGEP